MVTLNSFSQFMNTFLYVYFCRPPYRNEGRECWSCAADAEFAQTQSKSCPEGYCLPLGHPSPLVIRYQYK